MAVPKKKTSKRKGAQRRTHYKATAPAVVACPQCKSPKQPHHLCPECGYYDGREVVKVAGADS